MWPGAGPNWHGAVQKKNFCNNEEFLLSQALTHFFERFTMGLKNSEQPWTFSCRNLHICFLPLSSRLVPFWFNLIIWLKFKNVPRSWAALALNWFENNRSEKLFQSSKVFLQNGVANSVIFTSLIRGYQPRHLVWRRYSLPRYMIWYNMVPQNNNKLYINTHKSHIHLFNPFQAHLSKCERFERNFNSFQLPSPILHLESLHPASVFADELSAKVSSHQIVFGEFFWIVFLIASSSLFLSHLTHLNTIYVFTSKNIWIYIQAHALLQKKHLSMGRIFIE